MADLISREAALDLLHYYPIKNPEPTDIIPAVLETARKFIARLPAVDAVEVVRCKDCEWGGKCEVECLLREIDKIADPYCAAGKRREENELVER